MSERTVAKALREALHRVRDQSEHSPNPEWQTCFYCEHMADDLAPTVAAMLAEARAEVVRDVAAIPAPGPFDYLADWAQYRSLVLQALARYMPAAVREGGTERRPAPGGSEDGPQESAGPSDGRTRPLPLVPTTRTVGGVESATFTPTCGEALGDMRCQLRRGHAGDHEDYRAVAQERRA